MTVSLEDCIARLETLGYSFVYGTDEGDLQFEIDKILDYAVNLCNLTDANQLPDVLTKRTIDRICMEFLFFKKNTGQLVNFDYDYCLKSIEQGDTKVTYAVGQDGETDASRFNKTLDYMSKGYDKWICKYRVIRW